MQTCRYTFQYLGNKNEIHDRTNNKKLKTIFVRPNSIVLLNVEQAKQNIWK